jgi:hypothetical protein
MPDIFPKEANPTSYILSITFFPISKGKREFSLSDLAGGFLGTYGQFNVLQWTKGGIKLREASCFTIAAPTRFARRGPCDFWLFGLLKGVLKDREFSSSDGIEQAITNVWDELTFNEVQSVFHNWMSRLACAIANEREYIIE